MMIFNNDEMNLMCIYDTGSRTGLMNALSEMRKELSEDEVELRELTDSTLNKLSAMSDEDYAKLELYPDFDDEEDVDAEKIRFLRTDGRPHRKTGYRQFRRMDSVP